MGHIVKLVSSGIALASEALFARKENKQRSRSPGPSGQANFGVVEVASEHEARQLTAKGRAVPANAPHEVNEDHLEGAEGDEAYWEFDEATDPDPSAYDYSPFMRSEIGYAEPESAEAKPDVHKLVQNSSLYILHLPMARDICHFRSLFPEDGRVQKANVIYMMIVNMPSEKDLATAKQEMEQEKNKGRAPSDQA